MRDRILDAAQDLVQERGLNAMSFQDLADAVGLKKPSLFHHFKNKDDLVLALLERCGTCYQARLSGVLEAETTAAEKLHGLAAVFEEDLKNEHPCLLGSLAASRAMLSEVLKNELKTATRSTIDSYIAVFEQGRSEGSLRFEGSASDAATAFLGMLQGLQVLARAKGDPESLPTAAASYIDSISKKSKK